MRHQLAIYGPAAVLVIAAFILAFQFIKPAPPDSVVMATGSEEGAYHAFAKRYAAYLAREGIELKLRTTAGSVENLALLRSGEVELGFIQGGVDDQQTEPELTSLGSVYYEPLWMFHRADVAVGTLRDLRGQVIAVGPAGSGTRALAGRLLRDNGVVAEDRWSPLSGKPLSKRCARVTWLRCSWSSRRRVS